MRTFIAFVMSMLVSFAAQAGLIVFENGDFNNFNEVDTQQFNGVLSRSSPIVSYGMGLGPGQEFQWVLNVPVEFNLYAILTTGSFGTGTILASPGSSSIVYAGTTLEFLVDGDFLPGVSWFSVAIDGAGADIIDSVYGGSLPISGLLDGTTSLHIPDTGGGSGGGTGGGTGNGGVSPIPEPGTISLMVLAGLMMVGFSLGTKRSENIAQA